MSKDFKKMIAEDVAIHVLHHIDSMYPKMWDGVSKKSARVSIKNTIKRAIIFHLDQIEDLELLLISLERLRQPAKFISYDPDKL